MRKTKLLAICIVAFLSLVLAVQANGWNLISNIYTSETVVSPSAPVTISPGGGSGHNYPCAAVGVPFDLPVSVVNPNSEALMGVLLLNFTRPGISSGDVSVSSAPCYLTTVTNLGVLGSTLCFKLSMYGQSTPYFPFRSGDNNVTVLSILYCSAGSYSWSLAAVQ